MSQVAPLGEQLDRLAEEARQAVERSASLAELDEARVRFLGKKGSVRAVLRGLGDLPADDRPRIGARVNRISEDLTSLIEARRKDIKDADTADKFKQDLVDVTLPGRLPRLGHVHPITQILNQCVDFFLGMGFQIALGPEIETDHYNFEALNFPPDHPARDMQDTFYVTKAGGLNSSKTSPGDLLLRTHTTSVQVRWMEEHQPPIRIICPGRVYRCETPDATHIPMFYQVDGFMVDEGVTFADLKGVLEGLVHRLFSPDISLRFRPSFFPFTEPSAEVDILCIGCHGSGCRLCKGSGYLEILGSGMIDPAVLEAVGYDSERYTGWAFGVGCERIAMLKWGITDLRMFYENDMRFLSQF